jgi:glucokinase
MSEKNRQDALLAIEIGGSKLQLVAFSAGAQVLGRWRYVVDKTHGAAGIRKQIADTLPIIQQEFNVLATGVGFGGPVNRQQGTIGVSHQIEGWSDFPLTDWLGELTQAPVAIENDANAAALGEAVYGAGKGYQTVFYTNVGSGIGGGLVQDKKLYHGKHPGEVEIGHLRMNVSGTTLEEQCCGWAIDGMVKAAVQQHPNSILATLVATGTGGSEARYLPSAVLQHCPDAEAILEYITTQLAWALSHVVHLFHPDIIILGGGISLMGTPLSDRINQKLPGLVMKAFHPVPAVVLAGLGEDVVPMGALAMIK